MNKTRYYKKNYILGMICLLMCLLNSITDVHARQTTNATHEHQIIVLIHGLMRTSESMASLRYHLQTQGYQVYNYSYPSLEDTIHEHGISLHESIEKLIAQNPNTEIDFVTHSMGGIIARDALAQLSSKELKQVGCLIMLAPPSQGSTMAKVVTQVFPLITRFIKPLAELSSDEAAYVHKVPIPKVKIGIIAGRFDAKSPPAATHLDGQAEPVIVNAAHTFIMDNSQTKILVSRFLEKGSFLE